MCDSVRGLSPTTKQEDASSVVDFFKEYADILDIYATLPDELVIVGDFNFHFDINTDVHVRRFRDLLYSHGMTQYVEVATHQEGHILDLIIARTYSCVVALSWLTSCQVTVRFIAALQCANLLFEGN